MAHARTAILLVLMLLGPAFALLLPAVMAEAPPNELELSFSRPKIVYNDATYFDGNVTVTIDCGEHQPPPSPAQEPSPMPCSYSLDDSETVTYTAPFDVTGDGGHFLTAFHASGSSRSASFTIDSAAPAVELDQACDTNGASGWCLDLATVFVNVPSDDGAAIVEVICAVNGETIPCNDPCEAQCETFNCESECLAVASHDCAFGCGFTVDREGTNAVVVSARDAANNTRIATTTVKIDRTPPTPGRLECVAAPSTWCTALPSFTSGADGHSGIASQTCRFDGIASACPNGTHPRQGIYTFNASATDQAGLSATGDNATLRVDTVPPSTTIEIRCPAGNGTWCRTAYEYWMNASDATSGVNASATACLLDDVGIPCNGTVSLEGMHLLKIEARDDAGLSSATNASFGVDTVRPVAPTLTCSAMSNDWCVTTPTLVPGSDATSGLAQQTCTATQGEATAVGCANAPTAFRGVFTFVGTASDNAGHEHTQTQTMMVDLSAPTVGITTTCASFGLPTWCRTTYGYTMSASDEDASLTLDCRLDGAPVDCSGNVTTEGPHLLNVTATDPSGRSSTALLDLGVDTIGPQAVDLPSPLTMGLEGAGAKLTFLFSEPMDRASTAAALAGADGWTLAWDETSRWLNLTLPVVGDRTLLEIAVGTGAKDQNGNALVAPARITMPLAYAYSNTSYAFVNISANGTNTGINCDDCGVRVDLPFAFAYYGKTYRELNVSSNGFVNFGTGTCSIGTYTPVPFPGSCYGIVAPFWSDLDARTCSAQVGVVRTRTIGEAPTRRFVVSWDQLWHYSCSPVLATFQLQLHEGSNVIDFQYENARSDFRNHMIGVINQNGTRHTPYAFRPIDLVQTGIRFSAANSLPDSTPPTVTVSGTIGTVSSPFANVTFTFNEAMDQSETLAALTGAEGWTATWTSPSVLVVSTSALAVGTTTLTMGTRAADASGVHLQQPVSRSITYEPNQEPPSIAAVANITREATSPSGAAVNYTAPSWTDDSGETGVASCAPASGSTFPLGSTTVTCTAQDSAANTATQSFVVTVVDTQAPVLSIALDPAEATGLSGWYNSSVNATLLATDSGSGVNASTLELNLDGSNWTAGTNLTLPEGETTLRARARDNAGNQGLASVAVKVDTTAPTLLSANASVNSTGGGWVQINFSEPMDTTATSAALENTTGWTLVWSEDGRTLYANRSLVPYGMHTFTLTTAARDAHGVHLAASNATVLANPEPPSPPPPAPVDPPTEPTSLAAAADGTNVTLTWGPPLRNNGALVTGYRVTVDGVLAGETSGLSFTATGLARGATHTFAVRAVNSAGEGPAATTSAGIPPTISVSIPVPGSGGWHRSVPTIRFTTDPADATILVDTGAGETPFDGNLTLPQGDTTLRWRATAGGLSSAPGSAVLRLDSEPPTVHSAEVGTPTLGEPVEIRARVTDATSGIAGVVARVNGAEIPLTGTGGDTFVGSFVPEVGATTIVVLARDVAGNEAEGSPLGFDLAAPVEPEEEEEEEVESPTDPLPGGSVSGGSIPLESTSNGGGDTGQAPQPTPLSTTPTPESSGAPEDEVQPTSEPTPPEVVIDEPTGAGARGTITIRITDFPEIARLRVVLIAPDGTETLLSEGQEVTEFDTSAVGDGFYVIEARLGPAPLAANTFTVQSSHTGGETLATIRFLVRNEIAPPAETTAVVVGAVAFTAATHAGLSAAASAGGSAASASVGGASAGFHPLDFLREVAIDAGQDKLRDKTKDRASLERKRRIRSIVVAVLGIVILGSLWAFAETEGWSYRQWLLALPLVGTAAALVTLMKYSSESALAYITHARPRVRLWVAGTLSLALSSIVFRNPFGYPAWVDETGESESQRTWKRQALRAGATIAGAAAFTLPFLALSSIAPWTFVSVGVLIALTNLATSAMPFGPLPGKDIWRWNKWVAVAVALAGFSIYVAYTAALAPIWAFWTIGVLGAAGYAAALLYFRRAMGPRPRRVPVAVSVPVQDRDPAATPAPEAGAAEAHAGAHGAAKPGKKGGRKKHR